MILCILEGGLLALLAFMWAVMRRLIAGHRGAKRR